MVVVDCSRRLRNKLVYEGWVMEGACKICDGWASVYRWRLEEHRVA